MSRPRPAIRTSFREPRGPKVLRLIELLKAPEGLTTQGARALGLLGPKITLHWMAGYLSQAYGYVVKTIGYDAVPWSIRPLSKYRLVARTDCHGKVQETYL